MSQNPTPPSRKIGLVEDDTIIRTYLSALLQSQPGVVSVHSWETADAFLADSAQNTEPDLLLVDLNLPGMSGIELIKHLHANRPDLPCIVLTASNQIKDVFDSIRSGACGYLVKESGPEELLNSIRNVVQDGMTLSPVVAKMLVEELVKGNVPRPVADPVSSLSRLTEREQEVLSTMSRLGNAKDVASHLGLSHETVRVHMKKIYSKLHVRSKTEAIAVLAMANNGGAQTGAQ